MKAIPTANRRPAFEAIAEVRLELGEWMDGKFIAIAQAWADGGHTAMSEAEPAGAQSRKGSRPSWPPAERHIGARSTTTTRPQTTAAWRRHRGAGVGVDGETEIDFLRTAAGIFRAIGAGAFWPVRFLGLSVVSFAHAYRSRSRR